MQACSNGDRESSASALLSSLIAHKPCLKDLYKDTSLDLQSTEEQYHNQHKQNNPEKEHKTQI